MKEFMSRKSTYVALAAVLVAVIAIISSALSAGGAGLAEILSEPFFRPLKSVMTSLVDSMEELYGYLYRYDAIAAENEELKARIARLEEEYREYTEISAENARLRSLLGFNSRHTTNEYVYEQATIISWTASNYSSSFTLNRGSNSGVELHDCVVDENGYLVGEVVEVTASSCTVITILDTTTNIGAMLYESGDTGVIEGDFALFKEEKIKLSYLSRDANIVIDDTVVTSGRGGTYPSGLIIGYIDSIGENPSGLEYYAIINPAADFDSISHLFIITSFIYDE